MPDESSEVNRIFAEGKRLANITKDQCDPDQFICKKNKALRLCLKAGRIFAKEGQYAKAGQAFSKAGNVAKNDLQNYMVAMHSYDQAGNCTLKSEPDGAPIKYERAVEMLIKMGDDKGVIEYTEEVATKLSHPRIRKELLTEFYENVLQIHEESSPKDLLNRYKIHHGEYFFSMRNYSRSMKLFKELVLANVGKDYDKEITEPCLIYSCLMAILTKGDEALKYIGLFCSKFKDFKESPQYLLIIRILKSIQNQNFDELADAVCHNA
ncbi:hypothetical protein RF11_02714 [Thelohanellus kitauei]|uniref:Gamma-soluble NSF attachment protein n=1 Tax=Thelohanellus kitauei TaxID=669202 RepID=A0A0C2IIX3_THEKT|nr:hypothetical protein RF11_02714 [Thelohanellus kitauei]